MYKLSVRLVLNKHGAYLFLISGPEIRFDIQPRAQSVL